MTIFEFADLISQSIDVTRYANQNGRWSAQFHRSEIKKGEMLHGIYGDGTDAQSAIVAYINKIKGETIVFHPTSPDLRCQYKIPNDLTI